MVLFGNIFLLLLPPLLSPFSSGGLDFGFLAGAVSYAGTVCRVERVKVPMALSLYRLVK